MSELIPYSRPRGAIHDLSHIETLSSERCNLLCVSDRTLYLLHNFAFLDCTFLSRYAVALLDDYYIPVFPGHPYHALFLEVVQNFQLEVEAMTCDIITGLADALSQVTTNVVVNCNCGAGCNGETMERCTRPLDEEDIFGPGDQEHEDPATGDPPQGFATWGEYFVYKCQASHFIWLVIRKYLVAVLNYDGLSLAPDIISTGLASLDAVLNLVLTPLAWLTWVTNMLRVAVLGSNQFWFMQQAVDYWDDHYDDILCALYSSGTSVDAVSGVADALEDTIQAIVAWGALEPIAGVLAEQLAGAFGLVAGNGLVRPLFEATAAVVGYGADCSDCESGAGDLFLTRQYTPFNELLVGLSVDALDDSIWYGYQAQNSGTEVTIYFDPPGNIDAWYFSVYATAPDHEGEAVTVQFRLEYQDGEDWYIYASWDGYEIPADGTLHIEEDVTDKPLDSEIHYRFVADVWNFNYYAWFRGILGASAA